MYTVFNLSSAGGVYTFEGCWMYPDFLNLM